MLIAGKDMSLHLYIHLLICFGVSCKKVGAELVFIGQLPGIIFILINERQSKAQEVSRQNFGNNKMNEWMN